MPQIRVNAERLDATCGVIAPVKRAGCLPAADFGLAQPEQAELYLLKLPSCRRRGRWRRGRRRGRRGPLTGRRRRGPWRRWRPLRRRRRWTERRIGQWRQRRQLRRHVLGKNALAAMAVWTVAVSAARPLRCSLGIIDASDASVVRIVLGALSDGEGARPKGPLGGSEPQKSAPLDGPWPASDTQRFTALENPRPMEGSKGAVAGRDWESTAAWSSLGTRGSASTTPSKTRPRRRDVGTRAAAAASPLSRAA